MDNFTFLMSITYKLLGVSFQGVRRPFVPAEKRKLGLIPMRQNWSSALTKTWKDNGDTIN